MIKLHTKHSPAAGKSLAEAVKKATSKTFKQRTLAEQKLLIDWPDIVGIDIARIATPLCIRHVRGNNTQILDISTSSSNAPQVQMQEPVILEKIGLYFGHTAISRIKIHQQYDEYSSKMMPNTSLEAYKNSEYIPKENEDALINALEALKSRVRSQHVAIHNLY